jgi:hypothetical protein
MSERKLKKIWHGQIACAHCGKPNDVKLDKEIIEPAEAAVTEIRVSVEKSVQTTIA